MFFSLLFCIFIDRVVFLEAPDEFLTKRLLKVPIEQLEERHYEQNYPGLLEAYNEKQAVYEDTFIAYLNEQEILYEPIDVSEDKSDIMQMTTTKVSHLLGRPRNYGIFKFEPEIQLYQYCVKSTAK